MPPTSLRIAQARVFTSKTTAVLPARFRRFAEALEAMTPSTRPIETWTIGKLITSAADYLRGRRIDEPRLAAEILLAHALGASRLVLYTRWGELVSDEVRGGFRELIRRAAANEPVAYIVGHKEFFSLDFEVTADVLIPRPETELLVERVIAYLRADPREAWEVFEPGTGSGCVTAAIAKSAPATRFLATDVSDQALAVARSNFARHSVSDRVRTVVADWMRIPADLAPPGGFDVIVANPPYVGTAQTATVHEQVLEHEPVRALFAGPDGLEFYRRTTAEAPLILKPDGVLFCEVGHDSAQQVVEIFAQAGWTNRGRWKDLAGIERTLQFAPPA